VSYRRIRILVLLGVLVLLALWRVTYLYLIAPLLVLRRSARPAPRAVPVTPASATPEFRAAVQRLAGEVRPLGFELREVCALEDGKALGIHAYDAATHDHLIEYVLGERRMHVVRTALDDGRSVLTANPGTPGVFSNPREHHSLGLPADTPLDALHRAHRAHVQLRRGTASPVEGPREGFVERHEREGLEHQVVRGLYRRNGDTYHATLRGAFVTTWRLLPPLRQLRRASNQRTLRAVQAAQG
jgi:hypothetical protein